MRTIILLFSFSLIQLFALSQNDIIHNPDDFFNFQRDGNIKVTIDKGEKIQGGILFTKSVYAVEEPYSKLGISEFKDAKRNITKKIFNFSVDKPGEYYLGAHVLGTCVSTNEDGSSNFQEIKVYVNTLYIGDLEIKNSEWSFVLFGKNTPVTLKSGINEISFESLAPFYPEVDALSITKKIDDFYSYVTAEKMGSPSGLNTEDNPEIKTKSAFEFGSSWTGFPYVVETPEANHPNKVVVPVVFTYYRKLNLIAGRYSLHTGPIDGDDWDTVDPIMYLFKEDDPYNYSFYDDNSEQGYHARINNVSLAAGDYYLVIRCKSTVAAHSYYGKEGDINVYMDNIAMNTNVPCSGYVVDVTSSNRGVLNYFTAYSTGIPKIFMIEKGTNRMRFHGGTYWYVNPMDYYWFDDARIQLTKNNSTQYNMLICAEGAMGFYYGNCDVYGAVPSVTDSRYSSYFPNLKNNDAMFSGPVSNVYNSSSWAGGIADKWYWIGGGGSPFVWSSWDNYFNNNPTARYAGAENFSPNYYGDQVVVAFSSNNTESGITSFAVGKNANYHTHGYSWETKLGAAERIFHPLASLNGSIYGNTFKYYYNQNNSYYSIDGSLAEKTITLKKSVELGLTVIEDVKLDQSQLHFINSSLTSGNSTIDELYSNWSKTINSDEYKYCNNPYSFFENDEGLSLIRYAKTNLKESVAYFADKLFNESEESLEYSLSPILFCEIAKDNYGAKIDTIKAEWQVSSYNSKGAYIAPLPETITKKYIKQIIDDEYLKRENKELVVKKDNDKIFSVYPNPISTSSVIYFNLSQDATISLTIYNQNKSTYHIISNKKLSAGEYNYSIDYNRAGQGMSVCVLKINGQEYSRKIVKY